MKTVRLCMAPLICALVLSGSRAAACMAYADYVSLNLQRICVPTLPADTNAAMTSWARVGDAMRQNGIKSWSAAEASVAHELTDRVVLGRIVVLPVMLLFILIHTRIFLRLTVAESRILLVLLIIGWLLGWPTWLDAGLLLAPAALVAAILAVVMRDRLRLGAAVTWAGIALVAAGYCCPLVKWAVPRGYAYLDDYEFPVYSPSNSATNVIVVHERLDLRPREYKVVLFVNGRKAAIKRGELEALLEKQKARTL